MPTQDTYSLTCAFAKKFALRLRELRESRGLTQEKVAELAGMNTNTYQKYERGILDEDKPANPRLSSLLSIANAFEMDVSELLVVEYDSSVTGRATLANTDLDPAWTGQPRGSITTI